MIIPCTWFASKAEPRGARGELDLAALVRGPRIADDKYSLPMLSPATYAEDYREDARVESAHAIGLDLDKGELRLEALHGLRGAWHTSHSHTDAAPRGRAFVSISRPVTAVEYRRVWSTLVADLKKRGLLVGREACNPSRAWFVPAHRPGATYSFGVLAGEPVDVDRVLLVAAAREEEEQARRRVAAARITFSYRYVEVALRRSWEEVARACEGTRNPTLNEVAYSLARLPIPESTITSVLTDAARVAGLTQSETIKTIASALRARRTR